MQAGSMRPSEGDSTDRSRRRPMWGWATVLLVSCGNRVPLPEQASGPAVLQVVNPGADDPETPPSASNDAEEPVADPGPRPCPGLSVCGKWVEECFVGDPGGSPSCEAVPGETGYVYVALLACDENRGCDQARQVVATPPREMNPFGGCSIVFRVPGDIMHSEPVDAGSPPRCYRISTPPVGHETKLEIRVEGYGREEVKVEAAHENAENRPLRVELRRDKTLRQTDGSLVPLAEVPIDQRADHVRDAVDELAAWPEGESDEVFRRLASQLQIRDGVLATMIPQLITTMPPIARRWVDSKGDETAVQARREGSYLQDVQTRPGDDEARACAIVIVLDPSPATAWPRSLGEWEQFASRVGRLPLCGSPELVRRGIDLLRQDPDL